MSHIQAPKGTYDLLGDEAAERDCVVSAAADVFASYGYHRIVTPEFEATDLFQRGVGEATDIVRKEMYTFSDKSGRSMTLRPEGTAPVCRAYLEHGLHKWPQPVKLWYYSPMFRYERPQAGRYREHYQIGAEAIGSADPAVDAEVIALLAGIFAEVGVADTRLSMNSMGDGQCRPAYVARLREYLKGRESELCGECLSRLEINPLRTFDCKVASCRAVLNEAPHIIDHLCPDCRQHFDVVLEFVGRAGLEPNLDYRLVRGLDYYTRTTFEFSSDRLGAQSGVGGGGRYDGLIEQLGGPPTPGVGWGSGLERITQVRRAEPRPDTAPAVFIVTFSEDVRGIAFGLAQDLRGGGIAAEMDLAGRSPKGQLKHAGRVRAAWSVLVGLSELAPDMVRLRTMDGGREEDVPAMELVGLVAGRLGGTL